LRPRDLDGTLFRIFVGDLTLDDERSVRDQERERMCVHIDESIAFERTIHAFECGGLVRFGD
jgi:hypothetical protein